MPEGNYTLTFVCEGGGKAFLTARVEERELIDFGAVFSTVRAKVLESSFRNRALWKSPHPAWMRLCFTRTTSLPELSHSIGRSSGHYGVTEVVFTECRKCHRLTAVEL
ncbi:hypothetical protein M8J71_02570 [Pseudarthrobacter sp. R1]|uniref:hypothetical protein n=1 Tax=Pseudarthrobacter sp. R1 TaxID=2944934 RepID=UPI00210EC4AE|nr:hypothetical protein [Pseudarthrobacter sp. R1]MCQ6269381.1 hypothetical protein [Pseudarthrobacter sp. R1]